MAAVAVGGWLVALSAFDIRHHRLPNALTLPGAVAVMIAAILHGRGIASLTGAAVLTAAYLVVHLLTPSGMGAGDVKLAVGLGALSGAFGVEAWLLAAFGAPTFTTLAGLASRRRVLPHGPSMCIATASAVLAYL
ncbi:prepilin peptidase [Mycobacterium sp. pW049]|uniref:prepilin peptidase n=1 Tax=[Mycobacterium] bulgaricum TaxID=3238985 RepID=UPI00351B19D5